MRPPFDKAVELAKSYDVEGAYSQIMEAIKDYDFLFKDYLIVDGCLNYVFTQLLRKTETYVAHWVIFGVLKTLFWNKPRYGLLERAIGLLTAMKNEFGRRRLREDALPIIDVLLHFTITRVYEPYEDNKIAENGDLE